jgi:prepilin-type N-terminal cleavage/methylation domain-containing protein
MVQHHKRNGFTLIELLFTLFIFSVLVVYSVTFSMEYNDKSIVKSRCHQWMEILLFARVEAIKYQTKVDITDLNRTTIKNVNIKRQYNHKWRTVKKINWGVDNVSTHWVGFRSSELIEFNDNLLDADSSGHLFIQKGKASCTLTVSRVGNVRLSESVNKINTINMQ